MEILFFATYFSLLLQVRSSGGPELAENHFNVYAGCLQKAAYRFVDAVRVCPVCLFAPRVEDPNVWNAEGEVVVDFLLHGCHAVFG